MDVFLDDADCRSFIARLERVAARRLWRCPAYTLMTNHFHLLVETSIDELSAGMRVLKSGYAQHFNEKYGRVGHLFQGRFEARVIRDEAHMVTAREYIWNNAVAIGRCNTADDWPWNGSI
jgi:putative transposase